jgi:hypothetical protein
LSIRLPARPCRQRDREVTHWLPFNCFNEHILLHLLRAVNGTQHTADNHEQAPTPASVRSLHARFCGIGCPCRRWRALREVSLPHPRGVLLNCVDLPHRVARRHIDGDPEETLFSRPIASLDRTAAHTAPDGLLRHVTYVSLKEDKPASEVRRPMPSDVVSTRGSPERGRSRFAWRRLGAPREVRHTPKFNGRVISTPPCGSRPWRAAGPTQASSGAAAGTDRPGDYCARWPDREDHRRRHPD